MKIVTASTQPEVDDGGPLQQNRSHAIGIKEEFSDQRADHRQCDRLLDAAHRVGRDIGHDHVAPELSLVRAENRRYVEMLARNAARTFGYPDQDREDRDQHRHQHTRTELKAEYHRHERNQRNRRCRVQNVDVRLERRRYQLAAGKQQAERHPHHNIDSERDGVKFSRHHQPRQQGAALQHVPQPAHGGRERNEQDAEAIAERLPRAEQNYDAQRVAGQPYPPRIDDAKAREPRSKGFLGCGRCHFSSRTCGRHRMATSSSRPFSRRASSLQHRASCPRACRRSAWLPASASRSSPFRRPDPSSAFRLDRHC